MNKVISGVKSRNEEQYRQYLLHKRQNGRNNMDKNSVSEQAVKEEDKKLEEPNQGEIGIKETESVRNENKVSTSETSQRRMSSEDGNGVENSQNRYIVASKMF